jgi:hypothetical protein
MWTKTDSMIGITKLLITAGCAVSLADLRVPLHRRWAHMPAYQHAGAVALIICYLGICILLWVRKLDWRALLVLVIVAAGLGMAEQMLFN